MMSTRGLQKQFSSRSKLLRLTLNHQISRVVVTLCFVGIKAIAETHPTEAVAAWEDDSIRNTWLKMKVKPSVIHRGRPTKIPALGVFFKSSSEPTATSLEGRHAEFAIVFSKPELASARNSKTALFPEIFT